jgi:AraC family transcriptional activator of pobA
MNTPEKTDDLHNNEFDWIPESICKEMGQFNVFRLESHAGDRTGQVPFMRPCFYKIILNIGNRKMHNSDEVKEVKKQSLVFYNPGIHIQSEYNGSIQGGYYCTFNPGFFRQYENFNQYEVFKLQELQVFDLSEEQASKLTGYYEQMLEEIDSDYIYKYDVLRNLVFEMLHFAMKMGFTYGV